MRLLEALHIRHYNDPPMNGFGTNHKQERKMTDQELENHLRATSTSPRVTLDRIKEVTRNAPQFHVFPGNRLTVCCLELQNGFLVTGQSSCVDPANYNREIGENIALKNAIEKVWELEGYALKQKLWNEAAL